MRLINLYISDLIESNFNMQSFYQSFHRTQPFLVIEEFAYEFLFILVVAHTYSLIHKFITAKRNFVIKKNNLMHVLACTWKPHHRSSSHVDDDKKLEERVNNKYSQET